MRDEGTEKLQKYKRFSKEVSYIMEGKQHTGQLIQEKNRKINENKRTKTIMNENLRK